MEKIILNPTTDQPAVTVMVTVYNHANYIRQCLDGVVKQQTTFPFVTIVHDDASTDGSAEIVREYVEKYPDLFIPVFQNENLYSRGISRDPYVDPLITGKYYAICEGDDWWIDSSKLQRQYDYMERNPDCSLCVHGARRFNDRTQRYTSDICPSANERDFSTDEVIRGGGNMFATNSMFFRAENRKYPPEYCGWGVGDFPLCIYLSTLGRIHFFPERMSVYRVNAEGSWTVRIERDPEKGAMSRALISAKLRELDALTEGRYHESILYWLGAKNGPFIARSGDWKSLVHGECGSWFKTLSLKEKAVLFAQCKTPVLYAQYCKFKGLQ